MTSSHIVDGTPITCGGNIGNDKCLQYNAYNDTWTNFSSTISAGYMHFISSSFTLDHNELKKCFSLGLTGVIEHQPTNQKLDYFWQEEEEEAIGQIWWR